ncbi:prefoldin subunit beta [archaeon]|nr:prefoldin subunit beta [archaeon]
MTELPKELEHQLAQFQQIQQQAEAIASQKIQMEIQLKDVEKALDEIVGLKEDNEVYRAIGNILIKTEKAQVEEKLVENKEILELRIKTLNKQKEKITAKLKELQQKIQSALKSRGIQG